MLGVDRLHGFLAHFGLGAATGVDISGERRGILPNPAWKKQRFKNAADQVWFPGETVIFGIGQGYLIVTPIQLAHMTAIVASRGKSFKPRLVKAFREQARQDRNVGQPGRKVEGASPGTGIGINGYRVMNDGTGRRSQWARSTDRGKTGPAQFFTVAQREIHEAAQTSACTITVGSSLCAGGHRSRSGAHRKRQHGTAAR